jgi:enoyl-CoA hydratase/carnithine racemase
MTNYTYTFITVDLNAEGVAVCTMNRPDSLNAINAEGHHELEELFAQLQRDDAVKAVVLTGAGRAFSTGGDVKGFGGFTDARPGGIFDSGARALAGNLVAIEKPVIAAVNGVAVGLGATIALLCDVVFMADTARIGDPHVKVGLVPGDGGAVIWPLLVGPARAKEYLMTGDLLDAAEAERIGLVSHVVPAEKLMDEALALATRLAKGPTLAIRFAKISVQRAVQQAMFSQLDLGLALEAITGGSHDHKEASAAFAEKREPRYEGR